MNNRWSIFRRDTPIADAMWKADHRPSKTMSAQMGSLPNIMSGDTRKGVIEWQAIFGAANVAFTIGTDEKQPVFAKGLIGTGRSYGSNIHIEQIIVAF